MKGESTILRDCDTGGSKSLPNGFRYEGTWLHLVLSAMEEGAQHPVDAALIHDISFTAVARR